MTPSYQDNRIIVFDNFLTNIEQELILQYFDTARFRRILPDSWGKAYRLTNGDPLVGAEVLSQPQHNRPGAPAYPTQTALDILISRVINCKSMISDTVGSHGQAWDYFTMCPYVYAAGSGLGWHADSHCAGAYVYYAHRSWGVHWGGELLVEYAEEDISFPHISSRGILQNPALDSALKRGMGYYFSPIPNRVIFLRGHTLHMIKTVDAASGDNVRLSVSGFFLNSATALDSQL